MKKEDSKNKQQHRRPVENRGHKEEMFTEEQVMSLVQLVTAGVLGVGNMDCVKQAQKLPMTLQRMLVASILASRECVGEMIPGMLSSVLAKAAKKQ